MLSNAVRKRVSRTQLLASFEFCCLVSAQWEKFSAEVMLSVTGKRAALKITFSRVSSSFSFVTNIWLLCTVTRKSRKKLTIILFVYVHSFRSIVYLSLAEEREKLLMSAVAPQIQNRSTVSFFKSLSSSPPSNRLSVIQFDRGSSQEEAYNKFSITSRVCFKFAPSRFVETLWTCTQPTISTLSPPDMIQPSANVDDHALIGTMTERNILDGQRKEIRYRYAVRPRVHWWMALRYVKTSYSLCCSKLVLFSFPI